MKTLKNVIVFGMAVIMVAACSKDGDNNNPQNSTSNPSGFNYSDGIGVLAALKVVTITPVPGAGNYEATTYMGTAFFGEPGNSTGTAVGNVKLNNQNLSLIAESKVYFTEATFSTEFPPVNWQVEGNGSIPSFEKLITTPFPNVSVTLPDNPDVSSDLTIPLNGNVNGADSIIIVITGTGKSAILKTVAASSSQVTILKSQLSSVGNSIVNIQVNGVKYIPETISGKKLWFVLEHSKVRIYNNFIP